MAIIADLHGTGVHASTVLNHGVTSVASLVKRRTSTQAAITGTFFAPGYGTPVGDVLVDGNLMAKGYRGSVVAVDYDGDVHIFNTGFGHRVDYRDYQWALRGAVRLVQDGKVHPNPRAQNFHDPRIWGRASRTGVGVTRSGKLVLMATRNDVTLSEFGRAMVKWGVRNAVNLDGGSSTCLYYRGNVLIHPARQLSNMFVLTGT